MKPKLLNIILLIIAVAVFVYAFFIHDSKKPLRTLPIFGEKEIVTKNGKSDTVFHTVNDFSFTDQDGNTVTNTTFKNSIYVTDYFFTTCHSICPIMSNQMERIYTTYKDNDEVKFLSHTVDPEIDSVEQLKRYSLKHNADSKQWKFVTGDKKHLYDIARSAYYLDAQQGDGGPDDFIHTQNFALIDKNRHIRGYYDGTDSSDVNQLIKDIELLLSEHHYNENKK